MEERQEGTLETVQEQPSEAEEAKQEFVLNEDGQVEGDFSDWGIPSEEEEQPQEEEKPQYYTKEEIEQLGIDKLDPNRIPPELQPFYKSMQADYTRKTQAVAQERKVVERILDKALSHPELAKEFMNDPELVSLAQQHPELAQKFQAVSQMAQPQQETNFLDQITEQAKQVVEQQLGEEFDEFNPKHIAAFNLAIQNIQQQVAKQQAVEMKLAELRTSEPHFAQIDQYAEQKLNQMPYAEAQKIIAAIQNGDIDTLLSFWNECRKEWYNQNLNQNQQPQAQVAPPRVESAGRGDVQTKAQVNPREFGMLDDDEKAQKLIDMGLI